MAFAVPEIVAVFTGVSDPSDGSFEMADRGAGESIA
jgi:hypothetical protein